MKRVIAVVLVALALPQAAGAAPGDDPRILELDAGGTGMFHISTSPETTQTVLFAPGERIRSVIISDPGAYQVAVSGGGDSLTLKANGLSALAVVTVRTDSRGYELELVPERTGAVPSVVRFARMAQRQLPVVAASPAQAAGFDWKVSGSSALRPLAIRDDGQHTFIEWHKDQAMPAIFAVGAAGSEEMVEGYVRGGQLTIDRVYRELIFRIDSEKAAARRVERKGRNG